jgi:hypothetical protein
VRVAQVPRALPPAEQGAVVPLGVRGQAGVLLGEEVRVARQAPVAGCQLGGALAQLGELPDDLVLAGLPRSSMSRRVTAARSS